jgi:hypothetical protein
MKKDGGGKMGIILSPYPPGATPPAANILAAANAAGVFIFE